MTVFSNVYLAVDAVAPHLSEVEKRERTNSFHSPSQSRRCGGQSAAGAFGENAAAGVGGAGTRNGPQKCSLIDEPFSALDALTRTSLQEELARIWMQTRKTVGMIANDIDEAILLADTMYTLTFVPDHVWDQPCGSKRRTLGPTRS